MATIEKSQNSSTVGKLEPALPGIKELPNADVVIFDGNCNFCQTQVRRLHWFAGGSLAFLSLHDPLVADLCPELTHEQLMQRMYVVTQDNQTLGGVHGIKYLSRRIPRMWFAAPLLHIPFSMPVWSCLYDLVARSRYQIAGKADQCDSSSCEVHFKK